MPKNFKGGNKTKKGKNKQKIRALIIASDVIGGAMYGCIVSNLGNGRCALNIIDDKGIVKENVQGTIRGCVRRCKFMKDDIILCAGRNFNKSDDVDHVDIIHKYLPDQRQQLLEMHEIYKCDITSDNIDFTNEESDESESDNEEKILDLATNEIDSESESGYDSDKPQVPRLTKSDLKKLESIGSNGDKSRLKTKMLRDAKAQVQEMDLNDLNIDDI